MNYKVWRLYGLFTGLVMCGSCFGVAAWFNRMQNVVNFYKHNPLRSVDPSQWMALRALSFSFRPAFTACYAITFFCSCAAQLIVFDRLSEFAGAQGLWFVGKRAVVVIVVAGNTAGLISNFAAAAQFQQAAQSFSAASDSFAANNTVQNVDGNRHASVGFRQAEEGFKVESVQSFIETALLIFIILAIIAAAIACARRLKAALLHFADNSASATDVKTILRKIVVTSAFLFITFLLRSVYSTMYAPPPLRHTPHNHRNSRVRILCL
jgi:hypothetical protein